MESAHSIRFLYQHFLAVITEKSLNTFYHACSYAKADYSRFMNVTAKMALHLIPEQLKSQPVFLCIDDTIISKFGTKFENVSKLFDHATHNGCNYLNGHCFVRNTYNNRRSETQLKEAEELYRYDRVLQLFRLIHCIQQLAISRFYCFCHMISVYLQCHFYIFMS